MQNNILDYLELTKENLPEKIAYCDSEGESITFLQLYKDVRTIGSYILDKTSESNKPIVVFTEINIKIMFIQKIFNIKIKVAKII